MKNKTKMNLPARCAALTDDETREVRGGTTEVFGMEFDDASDAVLKIGGIALAAVVGFNLLKSAWNNFVLPVVQSAVSSAEDFGA